MTGGRGHALGRTVRRPDWRTRGPGRQTHSEILALARLGSDDYGGGRAAQPARGARRADAAVESEVRFPFRGARRPFRIPSSLADMWWIVPYLAWLSPVAFLYWLVFSGDEQRSRPASSPYSRPGRRGPFR